MVQNQTYSLWQRHRLMVQSWTNGLDIVSRCRHGLHKYYFVQFQKLARVASHFGDCKLSNLTFLKGPRTKSESRGWLIGRPAPAYWEHGEHLGTDWQLKCTSGLQLQFEAVQCSQCHAISVWSSELQKCSAASAVQQFSTAVQCSRCNVVGGQSVKLLSLWL